MSTMTNIIERRRNIKSPVLNYNGEMVSFDLIGCSVGESIVVLKSMMDEYGHNTLIGYNETLECYYLYRFREETDHEYNMRCNRANMINHDKRIRDMAMLSELAKTYGYTILGPEQQ